jgi:hypothetical protein
MARRSTAGTFVAVGLLLATGCGHKAEPKEIQGDDGFHFAPPSGWIERDRGGAIPSRANSKPANLPLPALGARGRPTGERLLVRYDRVLSGQTGWLRISVGELPASHPLKECLTASAPASSWKKQADIETVEIGGLPAERIGFTGRWQGQDYLSESIAVRKNERVYIITASVPAEDTEARDQVRQAIGRATWQ